MYFKILLHFFIPISTGTAIYLLFRPTNLLVFHWVESLGFYEQVLYMRNIVNIYAYTPEWIVYSLPNGLWAYSFMFFIAFIWGYAKSLAKMFFIGIVIVLSVGSEFGQLIGLIPGTFCLSDVFTYTTGLLLGYYYGSKYPKGGIVL